ncbi:GNAT family N-acetyltransferase [Priestia endophytica]|uniref:GNAT family N-acetyltransferase n=1 Tax=Priestia endophytica TaxID=135735 RepID=A0AAX1Q828_9BACI|nr:GNAT family protein [Priestia endophytica]RAS75546.1 GNAT family N-acetyltransferase [Priestia endophytica]RAS91209.1 GNAT family N-acetyltransferase [Priestia endophytica]
MKVSYWTGENVKLRAVEPKDTAIFKELDDKILKNLDSIAFPRTMLQIEEWIKNVSQNRSEHTDDFFWIGENSDNEIIGSIESIDCDSKNGTFGYTISVLPPYRRKGYAKDMIRTLLNHYFFELRYQKATVCIYSFNESSIALHKSLGFIEEGRVRNMIYTEGAFFDEVYLGITKEEFKAIYSYK